MPNPTHLLIDTDALIQVFIARQGDLLAKLIHRCGVTPAVVPEVETEVRFHQKFKSRFEPQFMRARGSGNVVVLEDPQVRKLLSARGVPPSSLEVQLRALDQRCQEYRAHVGEGEAFTHAMAVTFHLPALSNDGAALRMLINQGKQVACPTLRFFDLLVFARRRDWIDDQTGEAARRYLDSEKEYLPESFKARDSFHNNWGTFTCRLSSNAQDALVPLTNSRSPLYLEVR